MRVERLRGLSVGARQAENVLADVREYQVVRHRRDRVEARLAEFSLDVVLFGEPEAAERVEACVRRLPGRLGGEELRHVRLGAARLLLVEEPCSLVPDEIGGLQGRVGTGNGKLHALVRTDRTTENLPLGRIGGSFANEPAPVADALRGDEDS